VIFPECTTSNGRALLRFADVFGHKGPRERIQRLRDVRSLRRANSPLSNSHALDLAKRPISITPEPSPAPPRYQHISLPHAAQSIHLLPPSESPSSPSFIVSDVLNATTTTPINVDLDSLKEVWEVLIANLGKTKRTLLTWEEKVFFMGVNRMSSGYPKQ